MRREWSGGGFKSGGEDEDMLELVLAWGQYVTCACCVICVLSAIALFVRPDMAGKSSATANAYVLPLVLLLVAAVMGFGYDMIRSLFSHPGKK
jgi:hypothetical protein